MIKILWFIHRPAQDIEGFERWYQNQHVPIGMRQELLQRFRISRSFYPQPPFVTQAMGTEAPRAYRFSEGYWQSLDDVRRCYSMPNGRAALSDGPMNLGPLVPEGPRPTILLEEEGFPVSEALAFDLNEGRYRAPLACKLFAFVRLKEGAAFDDRYRALATQGHPSLRGHVLGRAIDEVIPLGRFAQLPPIGAERYDRTLEYYFDSLEALGHFTRSELMSKVAALTDEMAQAVVWDAAQIQEVFYTSKGDQPLEEGWKALYEG